MKKYTVLTIAAIALFSLLSYGQARNYENELRYYTHHCDGVSGFPKLPMTLDFNGESPNQILKTNEKYFHILQEKAKEFGLCHHLLQKFQQLEDKVKILITEEPTCGDTPMSGIIVYMQADGLNHE
jgi:hypothetical protein